MIVRPAVTDDDLELWTHVRNLVEVDNPTTIEDVRNGLKRQPERWHWIAEDGGEAVGCVFVSRSSVQGRAFLLPRVLREARGRGVGTALIQATLETIRELRCGTVSSHVDGDDLDAMRFAARHGFVEVDRQVELVRTLGEAEAPALPPAGIELAPVGPEQRDELRVLLAAAIEDMPVVGGVGPELVDELMDEFDEAELALAALDGGAIVGAAGVMRYGAREDVLEHAMTTVARTHRGRGIAQALKQACVHWAAGAGYRELVTWTQKGNDAMQAVNVKAGFRPGHVSITVEGPLP